MVAGVESWPGAADSLTGAVAVARRLVRGQRASLMLPASDSDDLWIAAASGIAIEASQARIRVGDPISGIVAQSQQPLLVNQTTPQDHQRATHYETGSFISVPVRISEGQVGVLNVADPQGGYFCDDDLTALLNLADQIGLGVALTDQQARIGHLDGVNRDLRRQMIEAIEAERQRIAYDLHDGAGHTITAALLRLDSAMTYLPAEATRSKNLVEAVHASLLDYANTLHAMAFALRPRILQDLGLGATLRSLANQAREDGGPEVRLRIEGEFDDLAEGVELLIFRVVQEALTNIRKHARASHIEVTLQAASGHLALAVEDDGIGITVVDRVSQRERPSLGLAGIRERVEVFGGSFMIGPRAGGGTRLAVWLPR